MADARREGRDLRRVPLARRARQPDRLGRAAHAARASGRAGRDAAAGDRPPRPDSPGRYRLSVDLVEEHRFWLAELGNDPLERDLDVLPRDASQARTFFPDGAEPAAGWHEHARALHEEGYAAVGGALDLERGLLRRNRAELAPYAPGGGRHPRFGHPLVCPSLLPPLEPNAEVAGLPAYRADGAEPWMFDGRLVLKARI